jgi:type IV pilus assembly protein PilW
MTTPNFNFAMRRQAGVSLIELMVALVLGLFLTLGAVTIYNQSRNTYRTTEAVARLQEVGRLAMDVVESDVRMANYWGLSNRADYIINAAAPGAGTPAGFTTAQMARINACGGTGSNWAINLNAYLQGSNDSYALTCAALDGAEAGTDTLTVRRASELAPTTLNANRIYLQTSRIQGTLFVPDASCLDPTDPDCIPAAYAPPASQSRELVVNSYYVNSESTLRTDVPSLRRKRFVNVNAASAGAAIEDEEIVPGVEDMQIQFGVDTTNDTNADSYVDPDAVPAGAQVVSVVIWLRVRAEDPEIGFVDDRDYQYGGMAAAFTPNDNFRRIVVTKTIQLRNTRV